MKCFEPSIREADINAVAEMMRTGEIGYGPAVEKFEKSFSTLSGKEYNVGLNSASSAAYCLFAYLYEKHGSCDVYTPSVGFMSPAWAALKNGHRVYFIDVDDNLMVDFEAYRNRRTWHLERQLNINFNKSVFMPVLYGGSSDIDGLIQKVRDTNWGDIVVVDSAHCITPKIDSDYIFFSFHPVKPLTMSAGGILATNDAAADDYIRKYRNFGREQSGDTYDIVQPGFNFYMNSLNAALGLSQMKNYQKSVADRKTNFEFLKENIRSSVGHFATHDEHSSYYLATLILKDPSSRDLRESLKAHGAASSFHYPPLHKTTYFKNSQQPSLSNTEYLEERIINLPIHQNITLEELKLVVKVVNGYDMENDVV